MEYSTRKPTIVFTPIAAKIKPRNLSQSRQTPKILKFGTSGLASNPRRPGAKNLQKFLKNHLTNRNIRDIIRVQKERSKPI